MTIKQYGGVFGRNPTFNNVTIEGTLTFDGDIDINSDLTISGNLYLPDNSKAIFGDNDDLQIYHDGSNSYISEQGTGDLRVYAQDFQIRNADGSNTMLYANAPTGGIQLFHTGAEKLATSSTGIDVTGSVTADGAVNSTYFIGGSSSVAGRQLTLSCEANGVQDNAIHRLTVPSGYGSFNINVGGSERMLIDSSGNVGLGTVPTASFSNYSSLEIGAAGVITAISSGNENMSITSNAYRNSAGPWAYKTTNEATLYGQGAGVHTWSTAPSGTADAAITFTEAMRIDSSGNVGIGTSSPDTTLHIVASAVAEMRYGAIGPSSNSALRISRNDSTTISGNPLGYLEFGGNDATSALDTSFAYVGAEASGTHAAGDNPTDLVFGTTADGSATVTERMRIDASGLIQIGNAGSASSPTIQSLIDPDTGIFFGGADILGFSTGGAEAMRIDASGNVLVGKTTSDLGVTAGIELNGQYDVGYFTRSAEKALVVNRLSTDGTIAEFRQDGAPVGSIGTNSGYMVIGSPVGTDAHLLIGNGLIHPADSAGNAKDNAIDIGGSGNRFKDLYLSGGVVFGTTGGSVSSKTLDDYEEGTWTVTVADAASGGNESSSAVSGTYTKVGKMVYVQFNVSNIDTTGLTAGNDVYITGLPFATASVTGTAKYTGTAQLSVVTFSGTPFLSAVESATALRIVENSSGTGVDFVVVSQLASAAFDIHGNLVYQTT